jgi:hypothetical protein
MSATNSQKILLCVESPNVDEADGKFDVLLAKDNWEVIFPYVNSCLAMIFVLADGSVVCGHATALFQTPTQKKNNKGEGKIDHNMMVQAYWEQMTDLANKVLAVDYFFSGDDNWKKYLQEQFERENPSMTFMSNYYYFPEARENTALNVFCHLGERKIEIYRASGNNLTSTPTRKSGDLLYSRKFV